MEDDRRITLSAGDNNRSFESGSILFAQHFACHAFEFFERNLSGLSPRECFAEPWYLDNLDAAVVCLVKHLVTWLEPCLLPHRLWREQLSLLPHPPRCLRGRLSHRNNVYSSENISLARRIGIHQKYPSRHDLHAARLRHRHWRGLLLFDSGNPEPVGPEGNDTLHLGPLPFRSVHQSLSDS